LIGRDAELADLQAAYHHAVTQGPSGGRGRVTTRVVYGEMGIGKTALVSTFLADLPPDTRIMRVECSPAKTELPFSSVGEWVRELTGIGLDQPLEKACETVATALGDYAKTASGGEICSRLAELALGKLATASDEADLSRNRKVISTGIQVFLAHSALERPLVVLLEGLQWSDRPSLELVNELARRNDALPILVVLVTRPDDRVSPFIEGIVRIELKDLSAENQVRLLQARLGASEGVAQVSADLLPRAAGNPFFLLEMVDALLERGVLDIRERADGSQELVRVERVGAAQPLPSTLEQLIADRLNELPSEERALVEWLAVAGGPLSQADLEALAGAGWDESVARLCARGLCDYKGEQIDVRHPLTRDVAYLALERAERVRMHRRLGQRFAETPLAVGLTAAIVARHLARGNEKVPAANLYLEAAHAARASYQTKLSTRYYRRVVALLPEGDLGLLDAHEALETICRVQGRWRERRKHLLSLRRLAKQSGKPHWVATALLRSARFELDAGHLSRGLAAAQRAEQVAQGASSALLGVQAELLIAEMLRDLGDMQGALAAVDKALDGSKHLDVPPRLRAEVLRARGTLLRRVGRVHEAVEDHAEAIAVFRRVGARRMEARALNSLAFAMFVLARFEDAVALALQAIRIDLSIGGRFQIAKTLSNIGQCYARLGDVPRALAYLKRAREAHERYGDQDARADTLLATAEVLMDSGDLAAGDTFVRDAGALTAVTGSTYDSVHEKILRAILALQSDDPGGAVMYAFDARQGAEAQAYVAFHFWAMAVEALARVAIGEVHTGILLATTAMGAIETIQGSEYGLYTRVLCWRALQRANSPQSEAMRERAAVHARSILERIRDPELRGLFSQRPMVRGVLGEPAVAKPG
jgi:tetratricopeptide (TPR) repeat protein